MLADNGFSAWRIS